MDVKKSCLRVMPINKLFASHCTMPHGYQAQAKAQDFDKFGLHVCYSRFTRRVVFLKFSNSAFSILSASSG